jgi:hypothetical protein
MGETDESGTSVKYRKKMESEGVRERDIAYISIT